MSAIPVHQFMAIAGIDAERVLLLASIGKLPFTRGEHGELLVELDALTLDTLELAPQRATAFCPESELQLQEIIASEVVNAAPTILAEGLELAKRWQAQTNKSK